MLCEKKNKNLDSVFRDFYSSIYYSEQKFILNPRSELQKLGTQIQKKMNLKDMPQGGIAKLFFQVRLVT